MLGEGVRLGPWSLVLAQRPRRNKWGVGGCWSPLLAERAPSANQCLLETLDHRPACGPVVPTSQLRHDAMRYTHLPVFRLASVKALASRLAAESMSPPKKMLNSARAAAIR